jgi:hypothetical protein
MPGRSRRILPFRASQIPVAARALREGERGNPRKSFQLYFSGLGGMAPARSAPARTVLVGAEYFQIPLGLGVRGVQRQSRPSWRCTQLRITRNHN